jgi:galactarate dehydratase
MSLPVVTDPRDSRNPPRRLRLDARDNVAVILSPSGVAPGATFDDGLVALESIPEAHKIALERIAEGEPVRRYGEVIGHARRTIAQGAWVQERDLTLPEPPALASLPRATAVPVSEPELPGYTFDGFRNADGSVGTRNILGITTTVQCVTGVLEHAVDRIRRELLPRYPNVDDVTGLTHAYGCGVAISAPDAVIPIRTLHNLARNPNLGGQVLMVGLGCEKLQFDQVVSREDGDLELDERYLYRLQESKSGFGEMIDQILALAERRLEKLDRRRREPCPASALVLGMQCGGSDALSGITANPALGYASDLLVRAGATVLFSEVTEVRDAVHLLSARAETPEVAEALIREMDWYDRYLERGQSDRSANTTPGNKAGGLSNIVEKSLGSIVKSGRSALRAVVGPGERARPGGGLQFCATPASDFICGTLQLAAGMNLHVFTTGRGTPYGLAMAPVVKVGTRTELAERWPDLIDVDAGRIASGSATVEEVGWELFHHYLDVASGRKKTWAERHRLHNDLVLFNPAPVT